MQGRKCLFKVLRDEQGLARLSQLTENLEKGIQAPKHEPNMSKSREAWNDVGCS